MTGDPPPPSGADPRPVAAIFRSPLFNASETFVQNHASGLRRYRALLVGLEDKGNVPPALRDDMIVAPSPAQATLFRLFSRSAALEASLRAAGPRLIHAHFATDGLLALPLATRLGIPLVTTLHGYDVSRTRQRMLLSARLSWMRYAVARSRLTREGTLFLAVSEEVCRRALEQGYPAERLVTHHLGVDLSRFRPGDDPVEPGMILHVGRLTEKKGTALLLESFLRVRAAMPEARLLIVGDGPERARLEQRAGEGVGFLGAVSTEEVARLMRRACVLAVPSVTARDGDSEGLPTVIMEAAASALPAVGSDHGGIAEAIETGRTGLIVPERNAGALADALLEILSSADRRAGMGQAALKLAEQRFDARRQNARLETLYDEVLGQMRSLRSR
jgi:glycosyltransferase involved in cell wall biosynthesis